MSIDKQEQLLERLKIFAVDCSRYVKQFPLSEVNKIYGRQLLRSSSSPAANYSESMCSLTRLDWIHDINKCRKELNESDTWIDFLQRVNGGKSSEGARLRQEAKEMVRLFSSSIKSARDKTH